MHLYGTLAHVPLPRYVKLRVVHAPEMPGTFPPPLRLSDPDIARSLSSGFLWSRWRGKTFPVLPAHAQPSIWRIWYEAHGRQRLVCPHSQCHDGWWFGSMGLLGINSQGIDWNIQVSAPERLVLRYCAPLWISVEWVWHNQWVLMVYMNFISNFYIPFKHFRRVLLVNSVISY